MYLKRDWKVQQRGGDFFFSWVWEEKRVET